MRTFAHIVNPARVTPSSDLYVAQPITFASMKNARDYATGIVNVSLLSAQYPEDHEVIPDYFHVTPDLERSVLDVGRFDVKRKLPLVKDILDRAYNTIESDYIIFTNVDIGLLPNFYVTVNRIVDAGFDAFVINRRSIPKTYTSVEDIPLMLAEIGEKHKGFDCFIFKREIYRNFVLGLISVGAPFVGKAILVNQIVHATQVKVFFDFHLTFHIGNDKVWSSKTLKDYQTHNLGEFKKILDRFDAYHHPLVKKYIEIPGQKTLPKKIKATLTRFQRHICNSIET